MLSLLLPMLAASSFATGTPAFDPRALKSAIAGKPAEVLVLGSPHLSQLPVVLTPDAIAPLVDRLARFKPEVIAVEGLGGEECETLLHFKPQHGSAWDDYCFAMDDLQKATGLTVPAATTEVDRTLASWPAQPTAAQRRRLAMLFLAAGDRASATVQWLRLPEGERRAGDGLNAAMIEIIERKGKKPNENYALGAALAARLGLERVYLVDDHIADTGGSDPGYDAAMQRLFSRKAKPPIMNEYLRRQANQGSAAELLSFYRFLNDPRTQRASIAADMGAAAREPSAAHYGRQYLSWWEERNLRMVANIRHTFNQKPDARVLAIVGSTHKGYYDAYLNMMQDVRIIDVMPFLK